MKTITLTALLALASFNVFALENGNYIFKDHQSGDPLMYKSMELSNSACESGGVIVKFYNADPKNFCIGHKTQSVFKYKKCMGVEINEFPIKACMGIKRTVELVQESEVTFDKDQKALVLYERNIDDKKLFFEQEFRLIDEGDGKVKLVHTFQSHTDNRNGTNEVLFEKN